MQRVALGQPARARSLLDDPAGDPITDATVTVTVTSDRTGEQLLDAAAAAHVDGAGWVADLPPEAVAQLDTLAADWRAEMPGGQIYLWRTFIDVAGAHLFTLARAREHNRLGRQPVHVIETARLDAERALEDRCGFAFVPRYARLAVDAELPRRTDRFDHRSLPGVALERNGKPLVRVRQLVAAMVDGIPVAVEDRPQVTVSAAGIARGLDTLPAGRIELTVEHGLDTPPGGAEDAALLLAADNADTSANPKLVRRGLDDGGFEVFYSQDAAAGAFDIPAVESFCRRVERTRIV